ncbi:MAG: hypothetical protein AAFQ98_11925 [Bacteroidota bacterium]
MEMQDVPPSHEDSLRLISSMIETARKQIGDNGFHLLLWGWVTIILSLLHYGINVYTEYPHPYVAWFLTLPAALVSFIYGYRRGKRTKVTTYTDRLMVWVWVTVIVSIVISLCFLSYLNFQAVPIILLFAGNATFITGWMLRFRPVILGGIALWLGAVIAFLVPPAEQLLVEAIAIAFGYLIPGYFLRAHYKKQ